MVFPNVLFHESHGVVLLGFPTGAMLGAMVAAGITSKGSMWLPWAKLGVSWERMERDGFSVHRKRCEEWDFDGSNGV